MLLMSLAVITDWLTRSPASRTPRRSASFINTQTLILKSTTRIEQAFICKARLLAHLPKDHSMSTLKYIKVHIAEREREREGERGREEWRWIPHCPAEPPLIQTCLVFRSQQLRNKDEKSSQRSSERPAACTSDSCTQDIAASTPRLPWHWCSENEQAALQLVQSSFHYKIRGRRIRGAGERLWKIFMMKIIVLCIINKNINSSVLPLVPFSMNSSERSPFQDFLHENKRLIYFKFVMFVLMSPPPDRWGLSRCWWKSRIFGQVSWTGQIL